MCCFSCVYDVCCVLFWFGLLRVGVCLMLCCSVVVCCVVVFGVAWCCVLWLFVWDGFALCCLYGLMLACFMCCVALLFVMLHVGVFVCWCVVVML